MSAGTVLGIISVALSILRSFLNYAEQQKWIDQGTTAVILQSLQDSDSAIAKARQARDLVRAHLERNPSDVMLDDKYTRPGD